MAPVVDAARAKASTAAVNPTYATRTIARIHHIDVENCFVNSERLAATTLIEAHLLRARPGCLGWIRRTLPLRRPCRREDCRRSPVLLPRPHPARNPRRTPRRT